MCLSDRCLRRMPQQEIFMHQFLKKPEPRGYIRLSPNPLTTRETYQILRDIALGVRSMRRIGKHSWAEIYCGLMTVETDGWVITFYNDCDTLDYCDSCYNPEGRVYSFDSLQRFGTDPVELLSTWEHRELERLLSLM